MGDLLDLVPEQRDPVRGLGGRRLHLDHVALDAEAAAAEQRVVADVLGVDQLAEQLVAVVLLPHAQVDEAPLVLLRRAETVDARDGRDDHRVSPREKRRRGGMPEAVDVVVAGRVLLDVEVGLRDVRLGLVVVVVRDEVLDGIRGEELAELVAELGRQRLVVRDHERGALQLLDQPRHRRRLAGPGGPEQRLEAVARLERRGQLGDRLRLVTGRGVRGGDAEIGHDDRLAQAGERLFVLRARNAAAPPGSARGRSRRAARRRERRARRCHRRSCTRRA